MTRDEQLHEVEQAALVCTRCKLHRSRTHVVFGEGNPSARLMFVGEAPGAREDEHQRPFVGPSGLVLEQLLASIGMERDDVWITNVLLCRPPGNRNPRPEEIQACSHHLFRQVELVEPHVVATLGAFATKLLSGRVASITSLHGQEIETRLGRRLVWLLPLYHPALALHAPPMRPVLFRDFARIPELLERELVDPQDDPEAAPPDEQLGLFVVPGRGAYDQ